MCLACRVDRPSELRPLWFLPCGCGAAELDVKVVQFSQEAFNLWVGLIREQVSTDSTVQLHHHDSRRVTAASVFSRETTTFDLL